MSEDNFKFYGNKQNGRDRGVSKYYTEPKSELVQATVDSVFRQSTLGYTLQFKTSKKNSKARKYLVSSDVYAEAMEYLTTTAHNEFPI